MRENAEENKSVVVGRKSFAFQVEVKKNGKTMHAVSSSQYLNSCFDVNRCPQCDKELKKLVLKKKTVLGPR